MQMVLYAVMNHIHKDLKAVTTDSEDILLGDDVAAEIGKVDY